MRKIYDVHEHFHVTYATGGLYAEIKSYAKDTNLPQIYFQYVTNQDPNQVMGIIERRKEEADFVGFTYVELVRVNQCEEAIYKRYPQRYYIGIKKTLYELVTEMYDLQIDHGDIIRKVRENLELGCIGCVISPDGEKTLITEDDIILQPVLEKTNDSDAITLSKTNPDFE